MKDRNGAEHSEKNGQFVGNGSDEKKEYDNLPSAGKIVANYDKRFGKNDNASQEIVKVRMDATIQKQFDNSTPKERSKIAYHYIMDNLRGKYPTKDNREVFIERVGAKEIAHTLYEPKIRVTPELGQLIKVGEFLKISKAEHGPFKDFAYYKVNIEMANDTYCAVLNIGIRDNGDSTLYDINQFNKT